MAEESIFGLPLESSEPEGEETTSEPVAAEETVTEGPPEEEVGQPRDERGRFASTAPEVDPEPEEQALEAEAPEVTEEQPPAEAVEQLPEDELQARYDEWVASMPEGVKLANKYESVPEALRGLSESRDMWRRANDARKAEAQRAMELQEQYSALYRQMESVVPILQQAATRERAYQQFAESYRQQTGEYPEGYTPPAPQPAYGPKDVQAQIDARLAQERQIMAAQFQQAQEYQQLEGVVMSFYQDHPEIEVGGAQDTLITDAMEVLNESWDRYGIEIDPSDRGSLEILYEASNDGALLEVLRLNPQYFESEYGMTLARRDAAVISGRAPATTETTARVPASQVKTSGARKPFTESAAVGSSAPTTEDESDPWVRIKNAPLTGDGGQANTPKSIFFE